MKKPNLHTHKTTTHRKTTETPTRISALLDIVFKYLLGSRESTPLLTDFINAVEKHSGFPEIEEVRIENPFNNKTYFDDKLSIIDVRARDKEGNWYNIEVQLQSQKHFPERILYYWAETYIQQLEEKNQYSRLNSVVSINLLNFNQFPGNIPWHSCFLLRENDNPDFILTLDLILHFIEIKKVGSQTNSDLARWIYLLTHLGEEEDHTMKVLSEKNKIFRDVKKRYDEFTADEHARAAALARKMFLLDQNSREYEAEERGKQKKALETAAKLKNRKMPVEEICDITGLTKEEVANL